MESIVHEFLEDLANLNLYAGVMDTINSTI